MQQVTMMDIRKHVGKVLNRVIFEGPQEVTRHGEPVAVIVRYDEYRAMADVYQKATEVRK
jgi:prevent-host-death family protein